MFKKTLSVVSICFIGINIGCNKNLVTYNDAKAVETINTDFGSTDLQMIAEKMVSSLMINKQLKAKFGNSNEPPVFVLGSLRNYTSEHIDTISIMDKISTALLKTGKIRFSATYNGQKDLFNQYKLQEMLADPHTKKVAGKQVGSQYVLGGNITSIVKHSGRVTDVYYKVTLQLTNVESAIIEWADEAEIRKDQIRSIFGL